MSMMMFSSLKKSLREYISDDEANSDKNVFVRFVKALFGSGHIHNKAVQAIETPVVVPSDPSIRTFNPGDPSPINLDYDEAFQFYRKFVGNKDWKEVVTEVDSRDKDTPDTWVPRHPSLIRLTGRHPFNCEAPLTLLHNKGFITPSSLHYVRNHGAAPAIQWNDHRILVHGLVTKEVTLSMQDIITMPTYSLPVTLVCCGNRRKEQNMIKQTIGFNWGAAGVSTGVWTGVRLCDILKLAGVTEIKRNLYVRFASLSERGGDKLAKGVYGTSVPLARALDPSYDIMLAFLYNGECLAPDHGFPIRLIVPGYIGGRMIKWITNITVQECESQDVYHFYDNRVLPSHVDAELAISEDWWHKPEYICNDLSVNSAIAAPAHDEQLNVVPGRTYKLKGYAYTGGGRLITRVEVSLDSGRSWLVAALKVYERPSVYGKYWCWVFWEFDMPVSDLANTPMGEIVMRAWDEGHNTQPERPTWNVMGMLNNPWFRIKIHKNPDGSILTFEHPTLAGTQDGGWMTRLKGHPSLTTPGMPHTLDAAPPSLSTVGKIDSVPVPVPVPAAAVPPALPSDASKPTFTMDEVRQHSTEESAWIVVSGQVFDCTPFLKAHPGGADSILLNAGTDSTEEFDAIHSKKAWKMLQEYHIGALATSETTPHSLPITPDTTPLSEVEVDSSAPVIALDPKKKIPFKLIGREVLSRDSLRLTFALQSPKHILGLPIGQHMFFSAQVKGKLVMRAYTPTSSDVDIGMFQLVIKVYSPCKAFPDGGAMSQHLGAMAIGDTVDVKGPLGHVNYVRPGCIILHKVPHDVKTFVMLCGGTGITPIFQIISAVLRDASDTTGLHLLYANRTEEDILLRPELDALIESHPNRLHLQHVISQPLGQEPLAVGLGKGVVGRVTAGMIQSLFPHGSSPGVFALLCGPEGFLKQACAPGLEAHGYAEGQCIYF